MTDDIESLARRIEAVIAGESFPEIMTALTVTAIVVCASRGILDTRRGQEELIVSWEKAFRQCLNDLRDGKAIE